MGELKYLDDVIAEHSRWEKLPWYKQALTLRFWKKNLIWRPRELFYWLRERLWYKHHLLDIRGGDYRGGYMDRCEMIIYANFRILKDFVEREMDVVNWEWNDVHSNIAKELRDLYQWWTVDRQKEADAIWVHDNNKEWADMTPEERHESSLRGQAREDAFEAKQEANLIRLIKIRRYLWT
jgi:hypothetical protein